MPRRIWHIFVARNKEFFRDRAALGWSIMFPLLLVGGLGFTFANPNPTEYKVGVVNSQQQPSVLEQVKYVDVITYDSAEEALPKLKRHQVDAVLNYDSRTVWTNDQSPSSYLVRRVLEGALAPASGVVNKSLWQDKQVSTENVSYVDWVIPGVIGMNMMFGALYGLGYVLVTYRRNGVLRRFKASPISVAEFLVAQVMSRLLVVLGTSTIVIAGCRWTVGYQMHGSYVDLIAVFLLGTICMICVGMVVAARTASKELADGLLNLISWPMMLASGVWFSLEGTNPMLQQFAQLLPLTHVVNGMRAIMLEGQALADLGHEMLWLTGSTGLFLVIGVLLFRWEPAS